MRHLGWTEWGGWRVALRDTTRQPGMDWGGWRVALRDATRHLRPGTDRWARRPQRSVMFNVYALQALSWQPGSNVYGYVRTHVCSSIACVEQQQRINGKHEWINA